MKILVLATALIASVAVAAPAEAASKKKHKRIAAVQQAYDGDRRTIRTCVYDGDG